MRSFFQGMALLTLSFVLLTGQQSGLRAAESTRQVMDDVLEAFVSLIPYMSSQKHFKVATNEKDVRQHLNSLKKAFSKTDHLKALQRPGFAPSVKSLNEHLESTVKAFESGNKDFALVRLKSTTSLCMSCHTQLPSSRRGAFQVAMKKVSRNDFDSDFEFAEFLFMTRNYLKSLRYYEQTLNSRLESSEKSREGEAYQQIRQSFKRALTIFTKVSFNPDRALRFLEKFDDHDNLPKMTQIDVKNWMEQLEKWQKRKLTVKLNSKKEVAQFIDEYLEPLRQKESKVADGGEDVSLLVASGILSKFLSYQPDSSLTPRVLYWLAVADRQLDYNFFFSLADLYLKECIKQYPESSYAPQCFKEYKENLIYGYSGSGGTDIPEEERKELERLKSYLK